MLQVAGSTSRRRTPETLADARDKAKTRLFEIRKKMTPGLIEQLIGLASAREMGFVIPVVQAGLHQRRMTATFRDTRPSLVRLMEDGRRVGFQINGQSYVTVTEDSTVSFMNWLNEANIKGLRREDYGQPECEFRRTN